MFEEFKQSKEKFYSLVKFTEEQLKNVNEESFVKFRNYFEEIFCKIIENGRVDVELVDSFNGTQVDRLAKGIKIKTWFDVGHNNDGFSMDSLSPGQKSVVSICIILALQKIYPASFYCLDEISADLDMVKIDRFSEL